MTEHDDLKKMLEDIEVPTPDTARKDKVMRESVSAFEAAQKKSEKSFQGNVDDSRLMNVIRHQLNNLFGSLTMKKSYVALGSVAVAAIAISLMTTTHMSGLVLDNKETLVDMQATNTGTPSPVASPVPSAPVAEEVESSADLAPAAVQLGAKSENAARSVARMKARAANEGYGAMTMGGVAATADRAMSLTVPDVMPAQPQYFGDDTFEDFEDSPVKVAKEEPVSTFSIDVDTTSYAVARRALMNGYLPPKDAVRVEELINYFDYDYAVPESKTEPFKPSVAVYETPWNKDTVLMHVGIKGHELPADTTKPKSNLVFLLDVSGSMNSQDKLPLLKNAFRMLVDTLNADDTVSIVVYAGAAGTVLEPTKVSDKAKIFAALDNLSAGGSTAGGEGIRQAYALAESSFAKDGVNRVILATDGDFNVGITDHEQLQDLIERKRDTGIYLSVLGFGQGNYNDAIMQKLAQNGNGNAAYIDTLNEARKVLVDEASSTLYPIANDVKIQMEFNPEMVAEYRLIGYETRALKREDFNNDKVDAGDIGAGHTVTAIYELTPVGSKAQLVDDLRYGTQTTATTAQTKGNEYGFLKIRYKLPDESESKLITRPVTLTDQVTMPQLSDDMRFAAAVAAYGQLLRNESYMGDYSWDDVVTLATSGRGKDTFGYRSEFLNLVRLAKTAQDQQAQPQ